MNMKKNIIKFIKILIVAFMFVNIVQAQVTYNKKLWIKVGSLQSFFSAFGAERAWNANAGIYEGLQWPAWHSRTDNFVIDRNWIACKDFTDEEENDLTHKGVYFSSNFSPNYLYAISLSQSAKFYPPTVFVDGVNVTKKYEIDDIHSSDLPFDRILTNVVNTSMGVTVTRTVYAFSQQYHDNYFIKEYTYENTGNIDDDEEIELSGQTINEMYIGFMPRYATSREGGYTVDGQMTWGKYQWVSHMGNNYPNGDDSLRCFWSWLGQSDNVNHDNIGGPDEDDKGRLSCPQFAGMVSLHCDGSPTDTINDDLTKHRIIGWHAGDTYPGISNNNVSGMKELWEMLEGTDLYTGSETPMDIGISDPGPGKNDFPQDNPGNDGGGAAGFLTYGPYTLNFGEKVKIVQAEGVSGLSREKARKVGNNWFYEENLILPDGSDANNKNEYKNAWVYTGKDSILQTYSRARKNYESGYNIPLPPQPPTEFVVSSGGDKIILDWKPSPSETDPNFGGYSIYRATSSVDSVFHLIHECGVGTENPTIVNQYIDMSPIRGISYYYYISAFTDGSDNTAGNLNPNGRLRSNRAYTQTTQPAYLRRKEGEGFKDTRIVPNPYNIKARKMQFGEGLDKDKIMFYNIPGYCEIKIFSERGDLIKTLDHADGSGDDRWNLVSKDRQIIVSGIYVAYIKVTQNSSNFNKGESTFKKFIVIR